MMSGKKTGFAREQLKVILTLVVIAAISGGILAVVFSATKEKIDYQEKQRKERAIFSILPSAKQIDEVQLDSQIIYECKDTKGGILGLAFTAEGAGYQDLIEVLVVTTADLTMIKGIEILESVETPGLGEKITKDEFKEQFKNTSSSLKLSKKSSRKSSEETTVQAITGATISSQAVVNIINGKIKEIKRLIEAE